MPRAVRAKEPCPPSPGWATASGATAVARWRLIRIIVVGLGVFLDLPEKSHDGFRVCS
jgi:hypothetical protein